MKKQSVTHFSKLTGKPFIFIALSTVLSTAFFPARLQAQNVSKSDSHEPVIQYVGNINQDLVFRIELDNKSKDYLNLSISDEDGTVFYSEKFDGTSFSKRFKLDMPDLANVKLILTITEIRKKKEEKFEFSANTRTVQDYVIAKK